MRAHHRALACKWQTKPTAEYHQTHKGRGARAQHFAVFFPTSVLMDGYFSKMVGSSDVGWNWNRSGILVCLFAGVAGWSRSSLWGHTRTSGHGRFSWTWELMSQQWTPYWRADSLQIPDGNGPYPKLWYIWFCIWRLVAADKGRCTSHSLEMQVCNLVMLS